MTWTKSLAAPVFALVAVGCVPSKSDTTDTTTTDTTDTTNTTDSGGSTTPLGTFTLDTRIDGVTTVDPDSFGTRMCVAKDGESAVIYVLFLDDRTRPGENDLWMNVSTDLGATWLDTPIAVNHGDGDVWNPDLSCNELGVFVVWEDDRDGTLENHQIYFNRSTDQGATFLPEDVLLELDPDGDTMSLGPKIASQGQELRVAWYDNVNGPYDIFLASSSDLGSSWRDPVRVDSDPGVAYSTRPQLALGEGARDVWVTWEDSRDGLADIYFAHSADGGETFPVETRLDGGDPPGESAALAPQLCAEGAEVYVVWFDRRNGPSADILVNASSDAGDTWLAAPLRLDSDPAGVGESLFPTCVLVDGTLHVVWQDQRGFEQGFDIYHREVVAGVPGLPERRIDVGADEGHSDSVRHQIATDGQTILVAWQDHRAEVELGSHNGYSDLYYNHAPAGGAFDASTDHRIDSMDGSSSKADHAVSVLGTHWFAAWSDDRNGSSDIFFQSLPLGEAARPPSP